MSSVVKMDTYVKASISGTGSVPLLLKLSNRTHRITMEDVLHIPSLCCERISFKKMTTLGVSIKFSPDTCSLAFCDTYLGSATLHGQLYYLDTYPPSIPLSTVTTLESAHLASQQVCHRHFGHVNSAAIRRIVSRNIVSGVQLASTSEFNCIGCLIGKEKPVSFPSSTTTTTSVLELTHYDVVGPLNIPSLGVASYFITFLDDYSNWTAV